MHCLGSAIHLELRILLEIELYTAAKEAYRYVIVSYRRGTQEKLFKSLNQLLSCNMIMSSALLKSSIL